MTSKKDGLARQKGRRGLAKYDPKKGMARLAVAEVAEKHYARAKDATKLQQAIRAKLEAQAEFVFWWDTQAEKATGAVQKKGRGNRSVTALKLGENGLPDKMTISRWRQKLNEPEKFEAAYEAAVQRYIKLVEFEQTAHVGHNSGENEWYTPKEYIEAARLVLGAIDLDPASSPSANRIVRAAKIFTADDDGLERDWVGRVWMNPPYAQPLVAQFSEKLAASVESGGVTDAVVLVNNATETAWFRSMANVCNSVCFPSGRLRFWSPEKASATPLQGQAVLYAGSAADKFRAHFSKFGIVWSR